MSRCLWQRAAVLVLVVSALQVASAAFAGDDPILNPENGHWYGILSAPVDGGGFTWDDARALAAELTWMGIPGHLVTITTQQEQTFIVNNFAAIPGGEIVWFGGTDQANEGAWEWITGEPWSYESWDDGEPDGGAQENCLGTFNESFNWHDLECDRDDVFWYLVEFTPQGVPAVPGWQLLALAGLLIFGSLAALRGSRTLRQ